VEVKSYLIVGQCGSLSRNDKQELIPTLAGNQSTDQFLAGFYRDCHCDAYQAECLKLAHAYNCHAAAYQSAGVLSDSEVVVDFAKLEERFDGIEASATATPFDYSRRRAEREFRSVPSKGYSFIRDGRKRQIIDLKVDLAPKPC
jgi:hypothetical protein